MRSRLWALATGAAVAVSLAAAPQAVGATSYTGVATGNDHTCATVADAARTVRCWGDNAEGQLGDGSTTAHPYPAAVPGLTGVVAVAAGGEHTCALLADGTARCWGSDNYGQLGTGTFAASKTPVAVAGISTATAISAAGDDTCALLADGTVRCWGSDNYGQLGAATFAVGPVPVQGLSGATAVSVGGIHACALLADGTVRCWGSGFHGMLGDPSVSGNSATPVAVQGLAGASAVAAGGEHSCAIASGGAVKCWGEGSDGERGDGSSGLSAWGATPVDATGVSGAGGLSAGARFTCAVLAGGVRCWGSGLFGTLGNGAGTSARTPVAVSRIAGALQVSAGDHHACAMLTGGSVWCWGSSRHGALGTGAAAYEYSSVPLRVRDAPPGPVPTSGSSLGRPGAPIPKSGGAGPVSGTVLVRLAGARSFLRLAGGIPLPQGTVIDARNGAVRISPPGQSGDSAVFSGGVFVYRQVRVRRRLWTELSLSEPLACGARAAAGGKAKRRKLWGDGHGRFRTKGRDASAGVRGTRWLTSDTCTTTTIRVARGVVTVRDFVRRRTVIVRAGGSYTARRRR